MTKPIFARYVRKRSPWGVTENIRFFFSRQGSYEAEEMPTKQESFTNGQKLLALEELMRGLFATAAIISKEKGVTDDEVDDWIEILVAAHKKLKQIGIAAEKDHKQAVADMQEAIDNAQAP